MLFDQLPKPVGTIVEPREDIRKLPQFFRASPEFVLQYPIMRDTLLSMLASVDFKGFRHFSIDSRLHMLMPGMYPCIPGWHCDDFYRPFPLNQPDLNAVQEFAPSKHVMVLFGRKNALTRFISEPFEYDVPTFNVYQQAHAEIEARKLKSVEIEPNEMWEFGPTTWHAGSPATVSSWRYFMRLTGSNHHHAVDQLRTQTQVYLTEPFEGW